MVRPGSVVTVRVCCPPGTTHVAVRVALAGAGVVPGAYWGRLGLEDAWGLPLRGVEELGDRAAEPLAPLLLAAEEPPGVVALAVGVVPDDRAGADWVDVLPQAAIQPAIARLMSTERR